jgi:predicted enzyme related to lactoylglutathione lyase
MSERDGYEPGVPCWVVAVHPDTEAAVPFYEGLFGWEAENLMPAGHPGKYFVCRMRGRDVAALASPHPAPPPPSAIWATNVWVDSADATAAKVIEEGGAVIGEPFDSPGGGRVAILADPAGAAFCAWEPLERRGAQLVNEPGAWAMSQLVTGDTEGAKAFYGAVFGWTTETFDAGGSKVTLWRVPGYVGGEPQQPVSREVVGAMVPANGGGPPVAWHVDFWIDDAEEAARKAPALGGSVVQAPHDIAGFRRAVLADPQGAVFSVSQLML